MPTRAQSVTEFQSVESFDDLSDQLAEATHYEGWSHPAGRGGSVGYPLAGDGLSVPARRLLSLKVQITVRSDRFLGLSHQILVVVQVVQGQQDGAEHLVRFEKMAKIRPAEVRIRPR